MDDQRIQNWTDAWVAGLAGAAALTAVHQMARRVTDDAPRMDVLGERAIARSIAAAGGTPPARPARPRRAAGGTPPAGPALHRWALAGDLLCNSAYYSLIACGRRARVWERAALLGIAA